MEINKLIEELNSLTVMEAVELAKELEKRWGISTAIRIQIFNPEKDKPIEEEKSEYDVILIHSGARKIEVIKVIRHIIPEIGLKEAKDLASTPHSTILTGVSKDVAMEAAHWLEEAGADVVVY